MARGKPFHPTKKVTHLYTAQCCSSRNTREWSFASLYRKEVSDERPRPDPAPESCEGATGLEGRMSSLQNKLRGKRWVYLFDSLASRKRTRHAGTKSWLPLLRQTHVHTLLRERRRIRALLNPRPPLAGSSFVAS